MSRSKSRPRQSGNPARAEKQRQAQQGDPLTVPNGNGRGYPPPVPAGPSEAQLQAAADQLNTLIRQNVDGLRSLQAKGINLDPQQIVNGRIDTVIGAVARLLGPQGPLWEIECRMSFEQAMAGAIAEAQREGTKAQLSLGGALTPEQIRQLARQTGTYGGQ